METAPPECYTVLDHLSLNDVLPIYDDRQPGSVNRNLIDFDGDAYRGRPIVNSIGTDSERRSCDAAVTDTANRRYYGSFRKAKLNITARADHRLSANPENISIGTLGVMVPTQFGDLRLEGRYMNDLPGTDRKSTRLNSSH